MKKFIPLLLLVCLAFVSSAQKILDKGFIKMEVTDASATDEQMAMGLEMLKGTETNYYFNQERAVVKTSLMGGMVETTTLMNNKTDEIKLFFNMMGQKSLVETSKEEMEKQQGASDQDAMKNMKVTYDKKDTKEILGYSCYKATISNPDLAEGFSFDCYISNEIKANSKMIQGMSAFDLDGFPLEFVIDMGQMKMVYTTTEIKDTVSEDAFNVDATGYTKMTFEQFQKSMGQMGGGGFGF